MQYHGFQKWISEEVMLKKLASVESTCTKVICVEEKGRPTKTIENNGLRLVSSTNYTICA